MKNYEMPTEAFNHIHEAMIAVIDDLTSVPELLQNRDFREFCEDLHVAAFSASVIIRRTGDKETYSKFIEASNKLTELAGL